jgi:hypothetical protein
MLGLLLSISGVARADSAAAEVLFREARSLLAKGRTEEACDKFDESQRLDPSSGTLLNLARCHALLGRTASAWAEFLEAERLAAAQRRPERAQEARRQAAALEPKLSRLVIRVSELLPAMTIQRNSEKLAPSALGVSLPVDPGSYVIRVAAPGYLSWTSTVQVDAPGEQVLEVPPLERQPPKVSSSPPRVESSSLERVSVARNPTAASARVRHSTVQSKPGLPATFWATSAIGVVALGFTSVFGVLSLSNYNQANEDCPTHRDCSASAVRASDRANDQARLANIGLVTTLLAAGVAGYFYFDWQAKPDRSALASRSRAAARFGASPVVR